MAEEAQNILKLPFAIHEVDKDKPAGSVKKIYEARFALISFINKVHLGLERFTEEDRTKFYRYNAMCVRDGYSHMQILVFHFPPGDDEYWKFLDTFSNN